MGNCAEYGPWKGLIDVINRGVCLRVCVCDRKGFWNQTLKVFDIVNSSRRLLEKEKN